LEDGDVGDGFAVFGICAVDGGGEWEGFGDSAAVGVDSVEAEEVGVAGAERGEEDGVAIGGPAGGVVAHGVPGEAFRNAAVGVDEVDVVGSGDLGGVGDASAVGREVGAAVDGAFGGEAPGRAAVARSCPDVSGVEEGDFVRADGGTAEEEGCGREGGE